MTVRRYGRRWVTVTGPNRGRARLLDRRRGGAGRRPVRPARTFDVVESVDGLADGAHTLEIEVLGRHSPASRGRWVAVDRFDVLGP